MCITKSRNVFGRKSLIRESYSHPLTLRKGGKPWSNLNCELQSKAQRKRNQSPRTTNYTIMTNWASCIWIHSSFGCSLKKMDSNFKKERTSILVATQQLEAVLTHIDTIEVSKNSKSSTINIDQKALSFYIYISHNKFISFLQ